MTSRIRSRRPQLHLPLLVSAVLDVLMIVLFAVAGRRSHDEGVNIAGIAATASPFLVGAAIGWALMYVYAQVGAPEAGARVFRPERVVPFGIAVWISTVVVGMILRAALGAGTAPSFIGVATLTLLVFLVGWRTTADRLYRLVKG
ncbi:MAG: DUF3054 domain-containing protein [Gordonia sp. (in: high G+C Gram-positive bacteria)]|uniref:DUF3054 domain-containing protein n=1 Tax=Gordonia sp. (in: high G+C Gram-positive bacteria) TaxID=84139 RepID=UPI0039E443BA